MVGDDGDDGGGGRSHRTGSLPALVVAAVPATCHRDMGRQPCNLARAAPVLAFSSHSSHRETKRCAPATHAKQVARPHGRDRTVADDTASAALVHVYRGPASRGAGTCDAGQGRTGTHTSAAYSCCIGSPDFVARETPRCMVVDRGVAEFSDHVLHAGHAGGGTRMCVPCGTRSWLTVAGASCMPCRFARYERWR